MESSENDRLLALEDYLLLTAIVLLPWCFGGVEIWAYRGAGLLLVAGAGVAAWKRSWRGLGLGSGSGSGWLIPAFLLAVWGGLQVVPLPESAIRLLNPQAHEIYTEVFPWYPDVPGPDPLLILEEHALESVPEARPHPLPQDSRERFAVQVPECLSRTWKTLSLEPTATLDRLLWFVAMLLGILTLRERLASRSRRRFYLWALFFTMAGLAAFALIQAYWWNGKIYWIRRILVVARPFGPYFNPTNLAGVMELAVPGLVGYAWWRFRQAGRSALYEASFGAAAVGAATCLVGGIASASKLGAILIVFSLGMLVLLGVRTLRSRMIVVGAGLVVIVSAGLLLSETRLGERMEVYLERADPQHLLEGRLTTWKASQPMVRDFPLTGTGFGTFREVYPRYSPPGSAKRWAHTHNDYLQLLLEGGMIAAVLTLWLAWGYGRGVARRLFRSSRVSTAQLGLLVGVVSLSVHAMFDFNHQIPGNALLYVSVCALLFPVIRNTSSSPGRVSAGSRALILLLFLPLVATYGYRSVTGAFAGRALEVGHTLALDDEFREAAPILEKAAVGFNRLRGLRMAAEARLDRWDEHVYRRGPIGADRNELVKAAEDFLKCRCVAPASRLSMEGLGEVYDALEWIGRERRSLRPFVPVENPWENVGRPGRVAAGMMRNARDFAPNQYRLHGKMALTFWSYGLEDMSRESVRASAKGLPLFLRHWYRGVEGLPSWFAEEFAAASWEALNERSLFPRAAHLIDLGKLERLNGAHQRAVEALTAALEIGGDDLRRAEAHFHLGLALIALDRREEGTAELEAAGEHPQFLPAVLGQLGAEAERTGNDRAALEHYRRLRWEDPVNLQACMRFATVARRLQDWPAALEALRWAKQNHSLELAPHAATVETYVEMGDLTAARSALAKIEDWPEVEAEVNRLRRLIVIAGSSAG